MKNEVINLTINDSMLEYLGNKFTTVILLLESIYFNSDRYDLSAENKATILALDKTHYYNDNLFNLLTNEVLTKEDVLEKYHLKSFNYNLGDDFKEPKELASLSIMEVFEYDLKRSA